MPEAFLFALFVSLKKIAYSERNIKANLIKPLFVWEDQLTHFQQEQINTLRLGRGPEWNCGLLQGFLFVCEIAAW